MNVSGSDEVTIKDDEVYVSLSIFEDDTDDVAFALLPIFYDINKFVSTNYLKLSVVRAVVPLSMYGIYELDSSDDSEDEDGRVHAILRISLFDN